MLNVSFLVRLGSVFRPGMASYIVNIDITNCTWEISGRRYIYFVFGVVLGLIWILNHEFMI